MLEKINTHLSFYEPITRERVTRILHRPSEEPPASQAKKKHIRVPFVMQNRGNKRDVFTKRFRKMANVSFIFTTRQMETVLPTIKSKVPESVRSNVVYEIECSRCQSSYVWQTTRHLATRPNEHSRTSSPVGEHLQTSGSALEKCEVKIIDTARDSAKLLT